MHFPIIHQGQTVCSFRCLAFLISLVHSQIICKKTTLQDETIGEVWLLGSISTTAYKEVVHSKHLRTSVGEQTVVGSISLYLLARETLLSWCFRARANSLRVERSPLRLYLALGPFHYAGTYIKWSFLFHRFHSFFCAHVCCRSSHRTQLLRRRSCRSYRRSSRWRVVLQWRL